LVREEAEAAELRAKADAEYEALDQITRSFPVEDDVTVYEEVPVHEAVPMHEEVEPGQRFAKVLPILKWSAAGILILLIIGLAGIHFVTLTSTQKRIETLVSARLGEPVKMQSLHITLFPSPYLKLRQVEIGSQAGVRIADARIYAGWGTLLGDGRRVERIELEKIDLAAGVLENMAAWPAKSVQQQPAYEIGQISFRHASIEAGEGVPPPFSGELIFSAPGHIEKARLESEDGALKVDFSPAAEGLGVSVSVRDVILSSFLPVRIDSLQAAGTVSGRQIRFAELKGSSHGGKVSGSLLLSWDRDWSANGDIRIVGASIAPSSGAPDKPSVSGKFDAALSFMQQAKTPGNLFRSPVMTGTATLQAGKVVGFDLPAAIHYGVEAIYSAHTDFDTWAFKLEPLGDKQAYKSLRIVGPDLQLDGRAEVSAKGAISGAVKMQVETKKKLVRGNYTLGGTFERPTIRPAALSK
ncbi:MAG: AsmA family protein, partial [Pseudomonadota bacterium]